MSDPTETPKPKRKRAKRRATKLDLALAKAGVADAVAHGSILSIDPASGASSLPGFAIFHEGRYVESGVIEVGGRADDLHRRLGELARTIREDLRPPSGKPAWDVVIIEDVPDKNWKARKGRGGAVYKVGSARNQKTLHRSVGAVLAAAGYPPATTLVLYVHPATWHAHVGPAYTKSDEGDAIAMAEVAVGAARELLAERASRQACGRVDRGGAKPTPPHKRPKKAKARLPDAS